MPKKITTSILILTLPLIFSGCWLLDLNSHLALRLMPQMDKNNEVLAMEARSLLEQKRNDFTSEQWLKGPCLGWLNDEWVVDISHNPRQPVDDNLANQCDQYYSGEAKHFIELSPDNKIIKMQ
ncbi:hypothetical protein KJ855_03020 [Patescibacteria group bacterium]|nr:hypothetical protein [Patescibacteria group bacterium]